MLAFDMRQTIPKDFPLSLLSGLPQ